MQPDIPDYIDKAFLQKVLQHDERYKRIIIDGFSASHAAPAGNNYGSIVVRVTLNYKEDPRSEEERTLSLIVKGPMTTGKIKELLGNINDSEPLFYNKFLPEAYQLLNHRFAPEKFHSPIPSVIVMEDLKVKGYQMADRVKQLDYDHCRLYVDAAASFHAVSHALYIQNPDLIIPMLGQNMYTNDGKSGKVLKNMLKCQIESLSNHISNQNLSITLKESRDKIWDVLVEIHKPNDVFNSLVQVDPWTTNMMFRYDSKGKADRVKLIDFQNLIFGSPVHDLVVFLWSSGNNDVRKYKLEDLYSQYYETLQRNLKKLNCSEVMLTYELFKQEVFKFSPMVICIISAMPHVLHLEAVDLNEVLSKINNDNDDITDNPFDELYTDSYCENHLPHLLEDAEAAGIFDWLESINKKI